MYPHSVVPNRNAFREAHVSMDSNKITTTAIISLSVYRDVASRINARILRCVVKHVRGTMIAKTSAARTECVRVRIYVCRARRDRTTIVTLITSVTAHHVFKMNVNRTSTKFCSEPLVS